MILAAAPAGAAPADFSLDPGSSAVQFRVGSTFHEIQGSAIVTRAAARYDPATGDLTQPVQLRFPVAGLESGNRLRDRSLRRMFHPDRYPDITAEIRSLSCGQNNASPQDCLASGRIEMNGHREEVRFPVRLVVQPDWVRASGMVRLNRKDFALKPPGIPGLVKVDDAVTVEFDTVWKIS